jgi:hypothetical protein
MHPVVPAFRCLFSDDGPAKETNEETEDKEEAGEKETEQTRGDIKHYETPPSPRPPSPLREWQRLPAPGTSSSHVRRKRALSVHHDEDNFAPSTPKSGFNEVKH